MNDDRDIIENCMTARHEAKYITEMIMGLQRQVADLTAKLEAGRQWTNEQPRTPGWYWWKGRPDVCPDVHYVSERDIAEGNPPGLWCGPLEAPR